QNIGSKEAAMLTRRFERIALAQFLMGTLILGLIEHAPAQPVNPPTPRPAPTFNPSSPNTVPQPSYTPSTPSTPSTTPSTPSTTPSTPSTTPSTPSTVPSADVTSPAKEEPSTTTRSERRAKTRAVHHYHRARSIGAGPSLGSFDCSYGWCVRISPPYAYYRPHGWYRY